MRFALAAALAVLPVVAGAQTITGARYDAPTTRYGHGVLGPLSEWDALVLTLSDGASVRLSPPTGHVFEDEAPRLVDLDGDGSTEVIVVQSSFDLGAQLAVYGPGGQLAVTPHIGQKNRWLAVVGAADMDGDGAVEIAFVDRPHLAKVLSVWRWRNGGLEFVVAASGLTNHHFGGAQIEGGMRVCGPVVEAITADADWTRVMATRLLGDRLVARVVGPYVDAASLTAALACR